MKYPEIILDSEADVKSVLDAMATIINQFDAVCVSDLYDLVGIESRYEDTKWGWTSTNNMKIRKTDDKFALDLPLLEPIHQPNNHIQGARMKFVIGVCCGYWVRGLFRSKVRNELIDGLTKAIHRVIFGESKKKSRVIDVN